MTTYLITACGAVFLSVVVSFIIPQGKLGKTITFVLRIICIAILISPLLQLFTISEQSFDDMVDYDYICSVYSSNQSRALEQYLLEEYSVQSQCTVTIAYGEEGFYAEKVEVCLIGSYGNLIDEIYEYLEQADYINITVYEQSDGVA